jgi:hypothetical protein
VVVVADAFTLTVITGKQLEGREGRGEGEEARRKEKNDEKGYEARSTHEGTRGRKQQRRREEERRDLGTESEDSFAHVSCGIDAANGHLVVVFVRLLLLLLRGLLFLLLLLLLLFGFEFQGDVVTNERRQVHLKERGREKKMR